MYQEGEYVDCWVNEDCDDATVYSYSFQVASFWVSIVVVLGQLGYYYHWRNKIRSESSKIGKQQAKSQKTTWGPNEEMQRYNNEVELWNRWQDQNNTPHLKMRTYSGTCCC